jgi:hypothetical protein
MRIAMILTKIDLPMKKQDFMKTSENRKDVREMTN